MLQVVLTRGLPACGKTTWAKELVQSKPGQWKRIAKDDLRNMLDDGKWSGPNEKFVLTLRNHIIKEALRAGKHVIVDDTNFHPRHIESITQLVASLAPDVQAVVTVKDFTGVPLATCLERDAARANGVGADVILKMHHQYIEPTVSSRPFLPGKPLAFLCDLDGTLALLNGRNPYDASTCDQDGINEPVRAVVVALAMHHGAVPLFLSGRQQKDRDPTLRFLQRVFPTWQEGRHFSLFMRQDGDQRRDSIVKREMFDKYIDGQCNILLAIDDRRQVARECWRPLGIFVMDVGPGYDF